jgi:GlpG protein
MRLVGTYKNSNEASNISHYLLRYGIDNQVDISKSDDWGSSEYGDVTARLWVIDEDQVALAQQKIEEYLQNPQASLKSIPPASKLNWLQGPIKEQPKDAAKIPVRENKLSKAPQTAFGLITTAILAICTLLLIVTTFTTPVIKGTPINLPENVLTTSPVEKALIYDYPEAYVILDKIIKAYGVDSFRNPNEMLPQEKVLIGSYMNMPYWIGLYDMVINRFVNHIPFNFNVPMFEKIRQGEVWRTVTPIFLHYDIFHLFFNMIWLIVIGKQMEERLGTGRYLLFILLTALFSNTIQYLVAGPNFIGFSGVICGMITFIWIRQRVAAWEGYQLQSSTMAFISLFIVALFGIQVVSFLLEIFAKTSLPIGIANSAHLAGAAIGALLGSFDFFAYKTR